MRTLVAHEPPVVELLPDSAQVRAQIEDIYETYRAEGAEQAMQKFTAHAGLDNAPGQDAGAPRWEPSPQEMARMRVTTGEFLAHLIRPATRYRPDIQALRAVSTRIVVAGGATSKRPACQPRPRHSPASSVRPWSTSLVTTADSWPSPSNAAA